jgi:MSHA biogenesis protein MshE
MARPEKVRLGELLVQQQLIQPEQLASALEQQRKTGRRLGRVLVEAGYVTEEAISQALAKQLNIPYINLKYFNVEPKVARLLPEILARRFRAIVLEDKGNVLLVGLTDPADLFAYDEIFRALKRELQLAVVTETLLLPIIDRVYRRTEEITGLAQELQDELADQVVDFGAIEVSHNVEEAPVVKLLQTMFEDAIQVRASDIHIEPQEGRLQVRFRIDGLLHLQTEADLKIAPAVVLRLKLMAGLDISEKRLPQDGRFNVKLKSGQIDVRMSTLPIQYGESVVLRLLGQSGIRAGLDQLGLPAPMLARLRDLLARPNGMVLVTGPTGSGKTTTLYAALAEMNKVDRKIITVEDPVEYRLPGINQVQVNEKIDLSFSKVLRSALRQDPDIILVGEMRDSETAQIGLRAALTGHMVLSTLHTNDAASTPVRLMDMGVPRYMVAMSLRAVLAQRLVRTVCESCITSYRPQAGEIEWLRQELGEAAHQHEYVIGAGCTHCNGTGYQHRMGVFELLEMTRAVVDAAQHQDHREFIRVAREQMRGETLRRQAVRLVLDKRTTIQEAMRVSTQIDD